MRLKADLHTHTVASGHAYSTVTEIAAAARDRGIELVAITDHGPGCPGGAHLWHFWNMKVIPSVLDGVRILKGVEANVADTASGTDVPDEVLRQLDFVAVGFHPLTGFDECDRARNTAALLKAIANPLVDMVVHPGNDAEFPLDLDTVVQAAAQAGVIIELNAHSFDPRSSRAGSDVREREFAAAALAAGAPIAIGSDAHFALHVGRFDAGIAVAAEIGLAEAHVVNRSAASVLEFLLGRRERPRLEYGGVWESPSATAQAEAREAGAQW